MKEAEYRVEDGIAIITIVNPPVNALSAATRAAIGAALDRAADDDTVRGIVIASQGKIFIAGADISEFGKTPMHPTLPELIARLDASKKPIVAAIQGAALGGGLELAMACHARVAGPKASLGLPEVKLGLLPGAGGTQRLPRLIGATQALRMIVSGAPVNAERALAIGLVDDFSTGNLVAAAMHVARGMSAIKRTSALPSLDRDGDFDSTANSLLRGREQEPGPAACIEAVRASLTLSIEDGQTLERSLFTRLVADDRSRAMRHLFFAERAALHVPGLPPSASPLGVSRIAVIGAGTMGAGIAMAFANAGMEVQLIDTGDAAVEKGLDRIGELYEMSVSRGSVVAEDARARRDRITGQTNLRNLERADLVIEAVFEDLDVKKRVFAAIGEAARKDAILASNTSYLDVQTLGEAAGCPERVLGLHFFSPANVMKLVEIVRTKLTGETALATGIAVARRIGKTPVVVGNAFGFVGNRMLAQRGRQAERLLLEGATPQTIDAVMTKFGFRMGPFAMADLAGLDIGYRIRQAFGGEAPVADTLVARGHLGQKTGRGFYRYEDGGRSRLNDPDVLTLIEELSARSHVARHALDDATIEQRLIYPMINEGARILEEGVASRASDIDVIWRHGYNFPAWRGGPMFHADLVGLTKIADALAGFAIETGDETLEPAPLLRRLASSGGQLATLGSE